MPMRPIRTYVETSVFGGVFDEEFARPSQSFFDAVREGRFQAVMSGIVRGELIDAPRKVGQLFEEIVRLAELVPVTEEAVELQQAYVSAGVVTSRWVADALHVALATASGCNVIVTWNFRHIVHFQKIPLYNAVNAVRGYNAIAIHTPAEVIQYEEEELRLPRDETPGQPADLRGDERPES